MAVSANEIWQQMTRIGILDVDTAKSLLAKFRVAASKAAADDESKLLAQFLLRKNVVTRFQVKHLLAGRAADLRLGDFLILDRCGQAPLARWFVARRLSSPDHELIYSCNDDLASDRWVDPAWLQAHEAVQTPGLQPLYAMTLVASDPWRGLVRSPLPNGRALSAPGSTGERFSAVKTALIGQSISHALATLHAAQLVHGQVRPSRIWQTDQGEYWLLRDGGRPAPTTGSMFEDHRWLDDDQAGTAYLPPEYLGHEVDPSAACDIYALGATLFELYTGQPLRAVERPERLPVVVQTARDLGAAGDPVLRTIAYALDPDPQARFAEMESFARALAAVYQALGGEQAVALESAQPANELSGELLSDPSELLGETTSEPQQSTASPAAAAITPPPAPPAPAVTVASKAARNAATDVKPPDTQLAMATPPTLATPPTIAAPPPIAAPVASRTRSTDTATKATPPVAGAADRNETARPKTQQDARPIKPMPASIDPPADQGNRPSSTNDAASRLAPTRVEPKVVPVQPSVAPESATAATNGEAPPKRVRKRSKRNQQGPIIIGSVAIAILLAIVSLFMRPGDDEVVMQRPRPPLPPPVVKPTNTGTAGSSGQPTGTASSTNRNAPPAVDASGFQVVNDDRLLWVPPWQAEKKTAPLEMIPPGSQTILSFRLAHLLTSAGTELRDWLNPDLDQALQAFKGRSGVEANEIERLTISLSTTSTGHPRAAFTVKLVAGVPLPQLTERWKCSASRTRDGKTIYSGDTPDGDVYYTPQTEGVCDHFVFGPLELISSVAEIDGSAITMASSLQKLWDTSSSDADFVGFSIPNFLFADGREYLERMAPRALSSLRDVFIPDASGLIINMGFKDSWYGEFRIAPSGAMAPTAVVQKFNNQFQQLPNWAEAFVVDANVDPSWRMMAIRLPQYMRALASQVRAGLSDDLPTFNFYLPRNAAPQMLVATTLALSSSDAPAVAMNKPTAAPAKAMTAAELLDHPFSVSFEQEALKAAVGVILDEFKRALPEGVTPPAITIIGGDLEKSGITQNQQIRNFTLRDRPLREALSELCRQANPDKTATSLADAKQSLIWVIDPASTDAKPSILITTRPIATEKGYSLTKEFTGQ